MFSSSLKSGTTTDKRGPPAVGSKPGKVGSGIHGTVHGMNAFDRFWAALL